MPEIGESGVSFNNIAREWRCKYAMDGDGTPAKSASLKAAQLLLSEYLPKLKAIDSAEVSRVVCGGCGDFKVILKLPADKFGAFEGAGFVRMRSSNRLSRLSRSLTHAHSSCFSSPCWARLLRRNLLRS